MGVFNTNTVEWYTLDTNGDGGRRDLHRPFQVKTPCECGCDYRDGDGDLLGYIHGIKDGHLITIKIKDADLWEAVKPFVEEIE